MKKLALLITSALLGAFVLAGLTFAGPASAATCAFPARNSQGQIIGCFGGGAPTAPPAHHAPTAKQKAWDSWKHANESFVGWQHHHRTFVKHHSHSAQERAFKSYDKTHTYSWWVKHVWNKS